MGSTDTGLVPIVIGGGPTITHSAEAVRALAYASWGEGVIDSTSITVVEAGTPDMTVDVTLADDVVAIVEGDTQAGQGRYVIKGDGSTYSVSITAADATNPRVDLLVMEVKDTAYDASGQRTVILRTIDGTPTGGASLSNRSGAQSLSSLPDTVIPVADIHVPATDTSIEDAQIQSQRFLAYLPGRQLEIGKTTSVFTEAIAAGYTSLIDSITVIGDGVHDIEVSFFAPDHRVDSTAGQSIAVQLKDDTAATQIAYSEATVPVTNYRLHCQVEGIVNAFVGRKTFGVRGYKGDSGTDTYVMTCTATAPAILRARYV